MWMEIAKYLVPIATFVVGLLSGLWPHVQRPLTDYRQTLTGISQLMLCSVATIYGDNSNEREKLSGDLRTRHAWLVSSADSIPRPARPVLQVLGLLRPRNQIEEGARMLIGISDQLIKVHKDNAHLTELITKLGAALDITV